MVSILKVENVESPPQKPVINRSRVDPDKTGAITSNAPMTTQLTMLARKVAQGNPVDTGIQKPIPNRSMDPTPPPRKTHKRLVIFMNLCRFLHP